MKCDAAVACMLQDGCLISAAAGLAERRTTIGLMLRHPDRVWRLEGASNFRDLGGYPGHGGRPVRWRRLFRSDHLGGLTNSDRAVLQTLELVKALDFRGMAERGGAPYELPGVAQHSLAIEPVVAKRVQALMAAGHHVTARMATGLMKDLYRALVNDHAHRFAELFDHLLEADAPVVFHCTAGKDRTGLAAALVLLALGVPRDLVMQDYLLSNEVFNQPPPPGDERVADALAVLWRVQEDFLDAALRAVDDDHGGVESYLGRRLGLSRTAMDTLAQRYLQGE
jgi:protein-tyrosine phosphatase